MAYQVEGACVSVEFLVMGPIDNNVYIIDDGETAFVVDPTCDPERILGAFGDRPLGAIVLTHAHWDHVGAASALRQATGARVVASAVDTPLITGEREYGPTHTPVEPCEVDEQVADGDVVSIGSMRWKVLHTPGHTKGSICLFLEAGEREGAPVLIAGDTLFAGAHGRTDFEGGDPAEMRSSLARLAQLPGDTVVLPGHNNLTTIARERTWMK